MSDDLKKMMSKLKKEKEKVAKTPTEDLETETPTEDPETPSEENTDEDADKGTDVTEEKTELKEVDQDNVEGELAVLQNDGIFRRELLLTLRELVDVHKVNTQTLLDIKTKLLESDDGKGK